MLRQKSDERISAGPNDATLVVMDMQPNVFLYARWMINPVLKLMHETTDKGHGLVVVRYLVGLSDEIAPAIWQAYEQCPRRALAIKTTEDGADKILAACKRAKLSLNRLQFCGVTTDDCVTKTAHTLALKLPSSRVEVIKAGCACWQGRRFDWSQFSHLPNVVPV